jgi:hypothetical protein
MPRIELAGLGFPGDENHTACLGTVCFHVETILSRTFSHSYGYVFI